MTHVNNSSKPVSKQLQRVTRQFVNRNVAKSRMIKEYLWDALVIKRNLQGELIFQGDFKHT